MEASGDIQEYGEQFNEGYYPQELKRCSIKQPVGEIRATWIKSFPVANPRTKAPARSTYTSVILRTFYLGPFLDSN